MGTVSSISSGAKVQAQAYVPTEENQPSFIIPKNNLVLREKIAKAFGEQVDNKKMEKYERDHLLDHLKPFSHNSLWIKFLVIKMECNSLLGTQRIHRQTYDGLIGYIRNLYNPCQTCIQIGTYVCNWLDNSLVKIENVHPERTFLVLDLLKVEATRPELLLHDKTIGKILDVIAEYNRNKTYDEQKCNCQHFIQDVLKAIGIQDPMEHFHNNLQNEDAEFINNVFKRNLSEQDFSIFQNLTLAQLVAQSEHWLKVFESHAELDDFVSRVIQYVKCQRLLNNKRRLSSTK